MKIELKISFEVCNELRAAILDAGGNEVFAAGYLDGQGIVTRITTAARGHKSAVPVVPSFIEDADVLIHNHPSGNLTPSEPDLGIASRAAESCCGFYIINNTATEIYVVVEPVAEREIQPLPSAEIAALLSENGPLAAADPGYEERPPQIALTKEICNCFNNSSIGVFEAGTGVGKSYAYLLPALHWALLNRRRIVISTGTVNLQHQLIEKDIPAAEALTGKKIKAVLVKGRQHYICRRRLKDVLQEPDLFEDDTEELNRIAEWAASSPTGCRSDLTFMPDTAVWTRINSESDACMGMRCPFRETCFVLAVRKEAAAANILVVNHHLLFSDIQARLSGSGYSATAVLPPYHHIIFDEAHGIEAAATSFFSESFTRFKLQKQIAYLYWVKGKKIGGTVKALEMLSTEAPKLPEIAKTAELLRGNMDAIENASAQLLGNDYTARICRKMQPQLEPLFSALQEFCQTVTVFTGLFREIIESIAEEDQEQSCVWETKISLKHIEEIGAICKAFLEWQDKYEWVFWVERNRTSRGVQFFRYVMTPLSVAAMMKDGVFEPFESVTCVSATLQIGRSFNYWMQRCGVLLAERGRICAGEFPSPFPYKSNVLLAIPSDAPPPDSRLFQPYIETTVVSLLQAANGRSLVLFTSYEALRLCCDVARRELQQLGITVLKQGDDDRSRLLETFKKDTASILFATDSFWEGVDVPGESLSQVVIVKLPFRVPNDPVLEARTEAIEQRGGNPFMELSLPEAVMRFKQGFGRLMRSKNDRGVVTVLDTRLLTKHYGKIFLDSLPETATCFKPLVETLDKISSFLET